MPFPRLIPCLDVSGGRVVKGVNFVELRDVVDELSAEARERERDRAHVARAVVADGDPHIWPFVEGMPSPSTRTATRSARPSALKAASAT